ncbi:hypothetical protein B0H11DRAFT_2007568 [Mycena galericulata]|nr:hypothetical protein B0H11DRAFT_2007568 [Mycena galericulata]
MSLSALSSRICESQGGELLLLFQSRFLSVVRRRLLLPYAFAYSGVRVQLLGMWLEVPTLRHANASATAGAALSRGGLDTIQISVMFVLGENEARYRNASRAVEAQTPLAPSASSRCARAQSIDGLRVRYLPHITSCPLYPLPIISLFLHRLFLHPLAPKSRPVVPRPPLSFPGCIQASFSAAASTSSSGCGSSVCSLPGYLRSSVSTPPSSLLPRTFGQHPHPLRGRTICSPLRLRRRMLPRSDDTFV